jgi:hypothetical protein
MNFINHIKHEVKNCSPLFVALHNQNSRQLDQASQAVLHFVSGI